jgi:hypothetical protein
VKRGLRTSVVVVVVVSAAVTTAVLRSRSAHVATDVARAHNEATTTTPSWNPDVNRMAVVTTVEKVLGSDVGSCGGATEAGGGFINHLSGAEGEAKGQPLPSEIDPSVAFVEIDGLRLTNSNRKLWGRGDGDATTNAVDPNQPDIENPYMKSIHLELSRHWGTIRLLDGTIQGPFLHPYPAQTVWPPAGALVDVQGFVRWDAAHVSERGHSCSGWELHPVSTWRLHQ